MKRAIYLFFLASLFYTCPKVHGGDEDSIPILKKLIETPLQPDQKLRHLCKLSALYWTQNPDSSLWYGWQGLTLLREDVRPVTRGKLHFVLGMAWENKGNVDSAFWYLNQAASIYQEAGEERLYFRAIEQIGSLYRITGQYDTAIVLMISALEYFRKTGNTYQIMSTLFNIGSVYLEQNRYHKALEYYQTSAAYDSILNDPDARATHLLGIGTVCLNLSDLFKTYNREKSDQFRAMALSNFLECHQLFRQLNHNTGVCFTSMNLLSMYIGTGNYSSADSILRADASCRNFQDPRVSAGFALSEAGLNMQRGNNVEALSQFASLCDRRDQMMVIPEFYEGMLLFGSLLREQHLYDSAYRVVERSLAWARSNSVYPLALNSLSLLSEWALRDNRTADALMYFRQELSYKDSLFMVIGNEIFDEMEMRYRNQLNQAELEHLRSEQLLQRFRQRLLLLGAISVVFFLIILSVFFIWKHRKAKAMQKLAELRADAERNEKLVKEKDLENLRLEMQVKEQELVFHTLQGLDLTKLTRSISTKLEPFQIRFPKKKDQEDFAQILSEIRRDSDKDPLTDFEVLFRQMHGNYYERLLKICPDLSRSELQMCALLRLNLTTKDISKIINLTAASIDVVRSKIRKKLGLDQGQSLTSYLITLG